MNLKKATTGELAAAVVEIQKELASRNEAKTLDLGWQTEFVLASDGSASLKEQGDIFTLGTQEVHKLRNFLVHEEIRRTTQTQEGDMKWG